MAAALQQAPRGFVGGEALIERGAREGRGGHGRGIPNAKMGERPRTRGYSLASSGRELRTGDGRRCERVGEAER